MKSLDISIPYMDPIVYLEMLPCECNVLYLDGANYPQGSLCLNRYSYLLWDPVEHYELAAEDSAESLLCDLRDRLASFKQVTRFDLPPFQGGAAGFLSYELGTHFESLPRHDDNPLCTPDLMLSIYDVVLAFDHVEQKAWIVSSGFPEKNKARAQLRARSRLDERAHFLSDLKTPTSAAVTQVAWESVLSADAYCQLVEKAKQYIESGDIFEVNLSHVFYSELPSECQSLSVYQALRKKNPAPFSAYMKQDDFFIASASPEQFVSVHEKQITVRPIKGTIAKDPNPTIDQEKQALLINSVKDRAENIMIVDLMRNDLSRVCDPKSVQVAALCRVEQYASLHHLVSVVTGQLSKECDAFDWLRASFPGGSITGAPKIRAMEIIHELEDCARGAYCGSLGYISFNQDVSLSILIRSVIGRGKRMMLQVGGAVVLDSDPQSEYEETLLKAQRCLISETA